MDDRYFKYNRNDTVMWIESNGNEGEYLFTFDKVKIYNLFEDYPYNMKPEEVEISVKSSHIGESILKISFRIDIAC